MVVGVVCQFVILPFCGFCIARMLQLDRVYGVALMVMMSSPGGSFSNWWCSVFNADLAMSVAMTGASVLIGVVMLPINVYMYSDLLYGQDIFSYGKFLSILTCLAIIFVALILGLSVSYWFSSEKVRDRFYCAGNTVGLLLFTLSMGVSDVTSKKPVWSKPVWLHAAIATPIVCAIALTILVTAIPQLKLQKAERVAVVIEACYQNPALASSIVIGISSDSDAGDAVAVPILYGIYEGLLLAVFCLVAHYMNWTLVSCREVSLVEAIRGNFQHRADDHSCQARTELLPVAVT